MRTYPLPNPKSTAFDFRSWCAQNCLKANRDEDGSPIVKGKVGHLYQHNDEMLGLIFMPGSVRSWAFARKKLEAAGCTILLDCEGEGSALFSPESEAQVALAVKLVKTRRKRKATPEQLKNLRQGRPFQRRQNPKFPTPTPVDLTEPVYA